jgi:AcrR family transcriptional regulator
MADLSPGWQRKRAQTVERIMLAAIDIVRHEGIGGLTVHRLARDLGYTVGALYRYFPSKAAIIAELQRQVSEHVAAYLRRGVDAAAALMTEHAEEPVAAALAPPLVLARVYETLPQVMPERIALVSQALSEVERPVGPDEDVRVMQVLIPLLGEVAGHFREAARVSALARGNANERAMVFWGNLHGSILLRSVRVQGRFDVDVTTLTRSAARATLLGWGAQAGPLARAERAVDAALARAAPWEPTVAPGPRALKRPKRKRPHRAK